MEKKMFGGLAYLSNGKMFAGILKDELVVRVGPDGNDVALKEPHTRPMDFTGRPMKGYVYVSPDGMKTPAQLRKWLVRGLTFAGSLPPTKRKVARRTSKPITYQ
jgi:TfoX/Sxy family transcriptional regulator of competence genes